MTGPFCGTLASAADVTTDVPVWLGVAVLVALAVVFAVGVRLGRSQASQREVDALLRRETRFRHPAGSKIKPRLADQVRPMDAAAIDEFTRRFQASRASALSTHEYLLERQWQPAEPKRAVCGKAVHTSQGTVHCLAEPGHPGAC